MHTNAVTEALTLKEINLGHLGRMALMRVLSSTRRQPHDGGCHCHCRHVLQLLPGMARWRLYALQDCSNLEPRLLTHLQRVQPEQCGRAARAAGHQEAPAGRRGHGGQAV